MAWRRLLFLLLLCSKDIYFLLSKSELTGSAEQSVQADDWLYTGTQQYYTIPYYSSSALCNPPSTAENSQLAVHASCQLQQLLYEAVKEQIISLSLSSPPSTFVSSLSVPAKTASFGASERVSQFAFLAFKFSLGRQTRMYEHNYNYNYCSSSSC